MPMISMTQKLPLGVWNERM